MSKKKMTIEDLALITQKGFNDVDVQFGEVGQRFDAVEVRLDSVDIKLERIENLLLRAHDNRLEKLEDDVRNVKTILKIR